MLQMGAPIAGAMSGNRDANRIRKRRLSMEEGYCHNKNEHISCQLDLGPHTQKMPCLWSPICTLSTPPNSIYYTVL